MQHDVQLHLVASSVARLHRTLEAWCYYLALVVVDLVVDLVVVALWETEFVSSVSSSSSYLRVCLRDNTDMSVDAPSMTASSKSEKYDRTEELWHVHHVSFVLD